MDKKSFEQIEVSRTLIKEGIGFLKEGMEVGVLFWDEEPLLVEAPNFAEFEVVDTGPAVRGNSATNIFKEAMLENEVKIKVPLFIKVGDKVKVDTRDGSYAERVR
jgi:elongation factor P